MVSGPPAPRRQTSFPFHYFKRASYSPFNSASFLETVSFPPLDQAQTHPKCSGHGDANREAGRGDESTSPSTPLAASSASFPSSNPRAAAGGARDAMLLTMLLMGELDCLLFLHLISFHVYRSRPSLSLSLSLCLSFVFLASLFHFFSLVYSSSLFSLNHHSIISLGFRKPLLPTASWVAGCWGAASSGACCRVSRLRRRATGEATNSAEAWARAATKTSGSIRSITV